MVEYSIIYFSIFGKTILADSCLGVVTEQRMMLYESNTHPKLRHEHAGALCRIWGPVGGVGPDGGCHSTLALNRELYVCIQ